MNAHPTGSGSTSLSECVYCISLLPEVRVAPVGGGRGAAGTVVGAQGLRGHHKRGRDYRRVHTE